VIPEVQNPIEKYTSCLKRCEQEVKDCEAKEGKFGFFRLVIFIALIIFLVMKIMWGLAVCVLAFLAMIHFHEKLKRRREEAKRAVAFYRLGLDRINDAWSGKGDGEDPLPDKQHLYADDLDLFGTGSIFELINICRTHLGKESLAHIFKNTVNAKEIVERQEAVKELAPRVELRERTARLEDRLGESKFTAFETWTTLPRMFFPKHLLIGALLALFAVVGVLLMIYVEQGFIKLTLFVAIFGQYLFSRKMRPVYEKLTLSLDRFHKQLKLLVALMKEYEKETFDSKKMSALQADLKSETGFASQQFKKLDFWVAFMDHCMRNQFVILFAMLLQLNVLVLYYIDKWRCENGSHVLTWLKALGECEAMTALSAYAYENPDNIFPNIKNKEELLFEAKDLGHPLLPKNECVRNDIEMNQQTRLLIVSGSNMAGKSTFLRTIGCNGVLAYTGAPVRAKELTISPMAFGMTLKIQDSLQDGQSRFYSEIDRIRRIRDLMDGDFPVMFVLDELLSGTNSHERLIGSEALLRQFLKKHSLGLVTTHDLALTDLGKSLDQAKNIYLAEKWSEGKPDFEYKIYEGVQKQGNALQWMRALGLDV